VVELLRNDPSSLAADTVVKTNTVPKLETPVSENADDQAMLRQVIEYYHQTLKQEVEAQAYLKKRDLDDAELINPFELGYANRTLGLRLPQKTENPAKPSGRSYSVLACIETRAGTL
jgi:DNA primase|tara:strand:+ start:141 stop:491 length:351 start_codon:yes stop_codon:yes gene_type:complete